MITEDKISKLKWYDISIVNINDDDTILIILMFETMEQGNDFGKLLDENSYKFIVSKNLQGEYIFTVDFIETDFSLILNSRRTEENYPPVTWLGTGTETYITNGIWKSDQKSGRKEFIYNPEILPIDQDLQGISLEDSIGRAFSLAKEIQFWTSTQADEPNIVVLVFDKRQAVTAYNNLLDLADIKTTFLKFEAEEMMKITFVDGVNDFNIDVHNLKYDSERLAEFKEMVKSDKSFAFLIGMDDPTKERPVIIATKQEMEIITIGGYIE
jgi:hypothetical protein